MLDKFDAEYIAGGAAQNTIRVAQVRTVQFVCALCITNPLIH